MGSRRKRSRRGHIPHPQRGRKLHSFLPTPSAMRDTSPTPNGDENIASNRSRYCAERHIPHPQRGRKLTYSAIRPSSARHIPHPQRGRKRTVVGDDGQPDYGHIPHPQRGRKRAWRANKPSDSWTHPPPPTGTKTPPECSGCRPRADTSPTPNGDENSGCIRMHCDDVIRHIPHPQRGRKHHGDDGRYKLRRDTSPTPNGDENQRVHAVERGAHVTHPPPPTGTKTLGLSLFTISIASTHPPPPTGTKTRVPACACNRRARHIPHPQRGRKPPGRCRRLASLWTHPPPPTGTKTAWAM